MVKSRQENEQPYNDDRNGAVWMLQKTENQWSGITRWHFFELKKRKILGASDLSVSSIQQKMYQNSVVFNEVLEEACLMPQQGFNIHF